MLELQTYFFFQEGEEKAGELEEEKRSRQVGEVDRKNAKSARSLYVSNITIQRNAT